MFDPFCGIGTVVLEALRLGRKALGADLLPLAVQVTNVAATLPPVSSLVESWRALQASERVDIIGGQPAARAKSATSSQGILALQKWLHPRTLEDTIHLKGAIDEMIDEAARDVFRLVLAASLPSLSKRRSRGVLHWGWIADNVLPAPTDLVPTDPLGEVSSRLAKLFAFMRAVNRGGSLASGRVAFECDWTEAAQRMDFLPNRVDLLLTSPPYPYSIDYALSTRLSAYLLDLPFDDVRRREIGARYKRKRGRRGDEYSAQIADSLRVFGANVSRGGVVVLVLPDPEEYSSIIGLDHRGWMAFVGNSLGGAWRLEEWGIRSYTARRVVPSSRPQRHDHVLAFRRVEN